MLFRSFLAIFVGLSLSVGSVASLWAAELDGSRGVYVRLETVVENKAVRKLLKEISLADFQRSFRLAAREIHAIGYAELTGRNLVDPRKRALKEAFESAIRCDGTLFIRSDEEIYDGILVFERTQLDASAYFLPGYEVIWEGISDGRYKVVIRAKVILLTQKEDLSAKLTNSEIILSQNEEHHLPLKNGWILFKREGIPVEASDIKQVGERIYFTLPHGSKLDVPVERVDVRSHAEEAFLAK